MFIKLFLIVDVLLLITSTISLKTKKSSERISNLDDYEKIAINFHVEDDIKLHQMNKLQKLLVKVDEYDSQLQRFPISIDPNILDKSSFSFLTRILKTVANIIGFRDLYNAFKDGISTVLTCFGCHILMKLIVCPLIGRETMAFAIYEVCVVLRFSSPRVCSGIVEQMKRQVDYIRHNTILTPGEICGVLLGVQCYVGDSENLYWRIDIPKKLDNHKNIEKIRKTIKGKDYDRTYQILQITDIHLDPYYFVGSNSDCGEPLCCRSEELRKKINSTAGNWGSYPCDIPLATVNNAFNEMARNAHNVDLWYWTGDIAPHDVWQYTKEINLENTEIIASFLTRFTNKTVICAIGNHESVPVNSFPPPSIKNEFSISWLYNQLADQWSKWLPEQALKTLRYGGYYRLPIRPGFRIIVVNTNYCARLNFWSLYDPRDPADHLKWLIEELLLAEQVGDNVHIVGHVPPDNRECTQAWLYNFLAIVERFKDTIVGQFYGHTHADEFRVFYSNTDSSKSIGYAFLSPSLTTYDTYNPAYRIYTTNHRSEITNADTFFFNLTQANHVSKDNSRAEIPIWYYEYSMARNYSMNDFSHIGFDKLVRQLITYDYYLQIYYLFYHRFSDSMKSPFCDNDCRNILLSDIIIGNPYDKNPKSILSTG